MAVNPGVKNLLNFVKNNLTVFRRERTLSYGNNGFGRILFEVTAQLNLPNWKLFLLKHLHCFKRAINSKTYVHILKKPLRDGDIITEIIVTKPNIV